MGRKPREESLAGTGDGEGHHTWSGLPAYIGPQKQRVSQGGLVENIKCDYEGALMEKERNGEREGYEGLRGESGSGQ